jgi:hypothetical protein
VTDDKCEVFVSSMQIDNQMYNTPYPVVFLPHEPFTPPFFHLSLVKTRDPGIDYFRYLSFLVQEMNIFLEETLVYHLVRFWREIVSSDQPSSSGSSTSQQQQEQQ